MAGLPLVSFFSCLFLLLPRSETFVMVASQVKHMELKILAALNWDFSAPLGINFLR